MDARLNLFDHLAVTGLDLPIPQAGSLAEAARNLPRGGARPAGSCGATAR